MLVLKTVTARITTGNPASGLGQIPDQHGPHQSGLRPAGPHSDFSRPAKDERLREPTLQGTGLLPSLVLHACGPEGLPDYRIAQGPRLGTFNT